MILGNLLSFVENSSNISFVEIIYIAIIFTSGQKITIIAFVYTP
jgi:hypothetical protein